MRFGFTQSYLSKRVGFAGTEASSVASSILIMPVSKTPSTNKSPSIRLSKKRIAGDWGMSAFAPLGITSKFISATLLIFSSDHSR